MINATLVFTPRALCTFWFHRSTRLTDIRCTSPFTTRLADCNCCTRADKKDLALAEASSNAGELPSAKSLTNANVKCGDIVDGRAGGGEPTSSGAPYSLCSQDTECRNGDLGVYCQCYYTKQSNWEEVRNTAFSNIEPVVYCNRIWIPESGCVYPTDSTVAQMAKSADAVGVDPSSILGNLVDTGKNVPRCVTYAHLPSSTTCTPYCTCRALREIARSRLMIPTRSYPRI